MKYIKTKIIIFIVLCLMVLSIDIYAVNLGRNVYGLYTETYQGVHFKAPETDIDSIEMQYMQNMNCDTKTDTALEGSDYWQFEVTSTWEWWAAIGLRPLNTGNLKDMHSYYNGKIKFLARTSDTEMEDFKVGIKLKSSDGKTEYECAKAMKDFSNFSADGKWHEYTFDLNTSTDANLTEDNLKRTSYVFLFLGGDVTKTLNKKIDFDYIRWVKNETGSFSVTVKNISDNQETDDIVWAQDCYKAGWKSAQQYMELDLDYEVSTNWYVQLVLDNGKSTRKGLYYTNGTTDKVLQMAWRVSRDLLPNSDGDTLEIKQSGEPNWSLYDSGKNQTDPWWYPWAYFKEKTESDTTDYSKVWDRRGCHTFIGTNEAWKSFNGMDERKPKVYVCANCIDSEYNLDYIATINIILNFE